jgi:1-acyl-sn-glycerol-3-phosphate acyltransferase
LQAAFGSLMAVLTWIFCPISIALSGDYKRLKSNRCILMANHQIYTDWWYIWMIACRHGLGGNIKIMLKHELRSIPIFGWGMRFFEFIFLKRKWDLDKELLISSLNTARSDGFPIWLLIFPGIFGFFML